MIRSYGRNYEKAVLFRTCIYRSSDLRCMNYKFITDWVLCTQTKCILTITCNDFLRVLCVQWQVTTFSKVVWFIFDNTI